MQHALFELLPKVLGFVYSFFIVGMLWIEHHRIFRFIVDWDFGLVARNLVFLLCVAFIPFPTAVQRELLQPYGVHPLCVQLCHSGIGQAMGLALCGRQT